MSTQPFSAVFLDGSKLSQLTAPETPTRLLQERAKDLERLIIHLAPTLAIGVNVVKGTFYYGPNPFADEGWFPGPKVPPPGEKRFYLARSFKAQLQSEKRLHAEMTQLTLGYRVGDFMQAMVVLPDNSFSWR